MPSSFATKARETDIDEILNSYNLSDEDKALVLAQVAASNPDITKTATA